MKPIIFVTSNEKKLRQAQFVFPNLIAQNVDTVEIQSMEPKEIVRAKLLQVKKLCNQPFMVEDTSFYLDCLRSRDGKSGFPGPYVKDFLHSCGNQLLVDCARKFNNFDARGYSIIGYFDGNKEHYFDASIQGHVVDPSGNESFGCDDIFVPKGYNVALAHLRLEEQLKINQRGKALQKLKTFLEQQSE
jgi:non-canonical purine NTP pyrophosphatase (RdgB/HAM1 family)